MERAIVGAALGALLACALPLSAADPEGVWGIPPALARAMSAEAVGDSDRMTLRFRKR